MPLTTPSIIQITPTSASGWYTLTDHNRSPLDISYEVIEKSSRMADGTMRKFVVAKKKKFSLSWSDVPAATGKDRGALGYYFAVDGNYAMGWLKNFYEQYNFQPISIKLYYGQETNTSLSASASPHTASTAYTRSVLSAGEQYDVFITNFTYNIKKRLTLTDIVDVTIEFTEI